MSERRKRKVEDELRRIRLIGLVTFAFILALGGGAFAISISASFKANANSDRIDSREILDRTQLRSAAWRGCARSMLERSEQYVSQETAIKSPLIQRVFPRNLLDQARDRRRRNLPILNCDANLCGTDPSALAPRLQAKFLAAYAAGKMNPIPRVPAAWRCPVEVTDIPYQLRAGRGG